MSNTPSADNAQPHLRPEVLACQRQADDLRGQAEEAFAAAEFWASLIDCPTHEEQEGCEHPLCYRAWREYSNG